mgnify:CR=1 FL=1
MWTFDSDTDPGYWVEVDSPTNVALRDVTGTANGPVAVGDKGVAVGRGNDRWGVILENGPGARSRALHAVDTTDDGERVYFAGAGGSFGYYDLRTEQRRDYSQPRGNANTFYALAVAGDRGEEKFLLGDGSGNVVPGWIRDGEEMNFDWETEPNSGNAVEALAHDDDGYGYAIDVNSNVFMTTEDDGWMRVGVDDAQGSFYDCAFGDGVFLTGGGNGMVFEAAELLDHDDDATWTPTELGGSAVYGLDAGYGGQLACGEGGSVFVRQTGGEWEQGKYDGGHTFRAGLIDEQMVVVGSGGLIVERRSPEEVSEEERSRHGDGSTGESGDSGGSGGSGGSDSTGDDGGTAEERTDPNTSAEPATNVAGVPAADAEEVTCADGVESDIDWRGGQRTDERSGDGDPFDGRGENYDGDSVAAGEDGSSLSTDETTVTAGADGGSGNDPADEPDGSGNDPADEPDGGGNDSADEPDGGGNDESDEPDPPDDSGDDSGNDESDPADENTDSDADSPD